MLQVHFVTKLFNYLIIIMFNCKEIKIGFFGFQGGITHQDSTGHKGTIGPCDVQVKTYFEYNLLCFKVIYEKLRWIFFFLQVLFDSFFGLICIEFPLFIV